MTNRARWLLALVLLAGGSPYAHGQQGATGEVERLKLRLITHPEDAESHYQLAALLDKEQKKEEALAHLEAAVKRAPQNLKYGNQYRLRCAAYQEYDRSVSFFERLVRETPRPEVRLQLALAYVDHLVAPGPMGVIAQASLSTKSIEELNKILEKDPTSWPALYGRGMNQLHWPKAFRRTAEAVADFKKLLQLQDAHPQTPRPHFALTYIALGDAYVRDGQIEQGVGVWRDGIKRFPENADLQRRLAIDDEYKLVRFIDKERSLKAKVNTDLSVLGN